MRLALFQLRTLLITHSCNEVAVLSMHLCQCSQLLAASKGLIQLEQREGRKWLTDYMYRNPDNTPMGEEVKWLLKEGGGLIFECFDISLESTPTLHVVYISTPTTNPLVPSQSLLDEKKVHLE